MEYIEAVRNDPLHAVCSKPWHSQCILYAIACQHVESFNADPQLFVAHGFHQGQFLNLLTAFKRMGQEVHPVNSLIDMPVTAVPSKRKSGLQSAACKRLFIAESVWRDDSELMYEGVYCECFFTFAQLLEYVQDFYAGKVEDDADMEGTDEPPEDRLWWKCVWIMLRDGKYEKIQLFALSANGDLISFGAPRAPLCDEHLFAEHHYFSNPHNVIVPFEPGDILEYDEFLASLTEKQRDVYETCIVGGVALREYARSRGVRLYAVQSVLEHIQKKYKKFFE